MIILKVRIFNIENRKYANVRKRPCTGLKTLIPTMNTLKDTAVLNIIKTDRRKMCSRGQTGGLGINPKVFFAVIFNFNQLCINKLNSRTNIKKVFYSSLLKNGCLAVADPARDKCSGSSATEQVRSIR